MTETTDGMRAAALDAASVGPRGSRFRWLARPVGIAVLVALTLRLTGCMERLFYLPTAEPTPIPAGFAGAELLSFASADGTPLRGWFLPALRADGTEGNAPTVLHVHGNAGSMNSHLGFSGFLPRYGFNLVLFDYRGYGESGGSARRRADLIADADAAFDLVAARPDVDADRMAIFGQSLGGAVALNVAAERPELKAMVLVSPFASWRDIAADAIGGPVGSILAWVLIRDHLRPEAAAARVACPAFVLHGGADTIVPIAHGRRIEAALPNATFHEFVGGDHNGLQMSHPEHDRLIGTFLRRIFGLPTEP